MTGENSAQCEARYSGAREDRCQLPVGHEGHVHDGDHYAWASLPIGPTSKGSTFGDGKAAPR